MMLAWRLDQSDLAVEPWPEMIHSVQPEVNLFWWIKQLLAMTYTKFVIGSQLSPIRVLNTSIN